MNMVMLPQKPYWVRAYYQWIVDSQCTPYLVINANFSRCRVPIDHVENGEITLNISPMAIRDLTITNDLVEFKASFSGIIHYISAPVKAVLAIYASENQEGMFFDYEDNIDDDEIIKSQNDTPVTGQEEGKSSSTKGRSHLKLVE